MADHLSCDDAVLIVGEQQVAVEVDLGVFLSGPPHRWGGILRSVPRSLAIKMRAAETVRLRLSDGQERVIQPLNAAHLSQEAFVWAAS